MTRKPNRELRRGWTTGACATAAVKAALLGWSGPFPKTVQITLPGGEQPVFDVEAREAGEGYRGASIRKDAGDDPDVTHRALIEAYVYPKDSGGVVFRAGEGVGIVTRAGLPVAVGEPAINPVPRQMMTQVVEDWAAERGCGAHAEIVISVPGGAELAKKTWNPRLGIEGGISILGTTGIVRPFSCAAWIASIHRGIDVARAAGADHVAGCTGNTSEKVVQDMYGLPDFAMLDMGDFAGGLLKYLRKAPDGQSIKTITIGGGIGKMTKLAQGAIDLHSGRSQVDFAAIADTFGQRDLAQANTALEVYERLGAPFAAYVAKGARAAVEGLLKGCDVGCNTVVIDRAGTVIGRA